MAVFEMAVLLLFRRHATPAADPRPLHRVRFPVAARGHGTSPARVRAPDRGAFSVSRRRGLGSVLLRQRGPPDARPRPGTPGQL